MEILKVSSGFVWFPSDNRELVLFVVTSFFFIIGLSIVLVPIHEFIHGGIATIEGKPILGYHWGFDTPMWIMHNYPTSTFVGENNTGVLSVLKETDGDLLGVCMVSGLTSSQEVPHSLYEIWWLGIIIYLGLLLGYISMALLTKKQYVVYNDGMWGEQDSDIPSERE